MQWTLFLQSAGAHAAVAACLLPVALLAAALSWFLQRCYQPGMIFRGYYAWLTYWFWFKPRPRRIPAPFSYLKHLSSSQVTVAVKRGMGPRLWWSWFYKPLGGCILCQSTWVGTAFYVALFGSMGWVAVLWWPLYCGAVYGWVCLLANKLSPHK